VKVYIVIIVQIISTAFVKLPYACVDLLCDKIIGEGVVGDGYIAARETTAARAEQNGLLPAIL
jgi:hypothetical protein